MCLAQGPQSSDAGEAGTRGLLLSSQALYHWATALRSLLIKGILHEYWCTTELIKTSWGEAIECKACLIILSLFHNEFNKLNITGAQMLHSTYHMTVG